MVVPAGPNIGTALQGPILVVPSALSLGASTALISLQGMAPANTTSVAGVPPHLDYTVTIPLPLHITFIRPAIAITVRNLDPAESLLVSFELGMPMLQVPHGETLQPGGGSVIPGLSEIVLAAGGVSAVPFAMDVAVGLEWI